MFSNVISLMEGICSGPVLYSWHLDQEVAGGYKAGSCFTSGHLLDGIKQPVLDAFNEAYQSKFVVTT